MRESVGDSVDEIESGLELVGKGDRDGGEEDEESRVQDDWIGRRESIRAGSRPQRMVWNILEEVKLLR